MPIAELVRHLVVFGCVIGSLSAFAETNRQDVVLSEKSERRFRGGLCLEIDSAYLASGGTLCDTMPVSTQELDGLWDLGEYGWIDGYGWIVSSLHDQQRDAHRSLFYEFEGSIRYGYSWEVSKELSVRTQAGWLWNPQIGFPDDNGNYNGPIAVQSLENPYVVPYYNALWLIQPKSRGRVRLGLRRKFDLAEDWTFTPSIETVWSDSNRFVAKYGEEPRQAFLGGGFATERLDLKFRWQVWEDLAVYAQFQQFTVLGAQPRRAIRKSSTYYAKTDWIIGIIGIEYTF